MRVGAPRSLQPFEAMSSPARSSSLKEEDERFDELVLMSKNHTAGPPVLDETEMSFPSPQPGMIGCPSLFPETCPGLEEVTEPGLLSFLTGDLSSLQDQLSLPLFLGDNFEQRQLQPSPARDEPDQEQCDIPMSGTIVSSNHGLEDEAKILVGGGPIDAQMELSQAASDVEERADVEEMVVDRELFDDVSDTMEAAPEYERDDSSKGSSAAPASASARDGGCRKGENPILDTMRFTAKGKGVRKASSGTGGGSSGGLARSAVNGSLPMPGKGESGPFLGKLDEKENVSGQQSTRLRYSKGAAPSKYCHVCGRSAKTVSVALCGNNKLGLCRKVVCDKCLIMHQWGDFRSAKEAGSSWTCTHCRGDCPPRARCHQYQRNNMRRRLKSSSNHVAAENGSSGGPSGPRAGVSRGGIPLSGAAATSAAQHSARLSMRPLASLGPLAGVGLTKLPSGAGGVGGKEPGPGDELTPTNIIGAAGGVFQSQPPAAGAFAPLGWMQDPPGAAGAPGSFETGNLYGGFNFLE